MMRLLLAVTMFAALASGLTGAPTACADALDGAMASAAKAWLREIGDKREAGSFPFTEDERFNWHFTPRYREGAVIREMTAAQRAATKTLMRSTLSSPGILKAEAIMALEGVLAEVEGSSLSYRDPEKYFISIFGNPGVYPWGWRLEGHHLSINVTVAAAGEVSVTPAFLGSNPARVPSGPKKGLQVQYDEYILALRLARSLNGAQREQALLAERSLGQVVAGPGRGDALSKTEGLPAAELSGPQRKLLTQLINAYVGIARDEIGRPYMDLVSEGWGDTRFAWAGPMKEGGAFYYRIHGPRILIEFDNSQGGGNHIHSLWRDPANDFGRDDLHRHYKGAPEAHGHKP